MKDLLSLEYEKLIKPKKEYFLPGGIVSIVEHLPTIKNLSKLCQNAAEIGTEEVVSSFAIVQGLKENNVSKEKNFFSFDIVDVTKHSRWKKLTDLSKINNINTHFIHGDSLLSKLPKEKIDLLFIDGWHVYGQVFRELKRFSPKISKIICLHDTTVDGELGETIRSNWDAIKQSKITGIPICEINKGIWYAVEDFLKEEEDWILYKRYHNNNGFTILARNDKKLIKELDCILK